MKIERGLVHVYTGDAKGKTTAALGLALRALGWEMRVMMIQFIKGYKEIGEIKFAESCSGRFVIRQFALDLTRDIPEEKVIARRKEADQAMRFAEEVVTSGEYDLVILDELVVALHYELVDLDRVLRMVRDKPESVELVITGRNAPPELVAEADYVTEMLLIKHPFEYGVQARAGVDY
ncbi:MAG TPA: cob(I)yrinic acid a,c-diamide adenosyltransferase [Armatimonadota bacterium]|nr:cob(I)yrinic acid a,c-diamide adenosyltransferase [Armatimonadota bacterium]